MVRGLWPCVFYPLGLSIYLNLGFLCENAAQLEGELLHRKPLSRCQRPFVVATLGHLRKSRVVLGLLKSPKYTVEPSNLCNTSCKLSKETFFQFGFQTRRAHIFVISLY